MIPVTRPRIYNDAVFTQEGALIATHAPRSNVANGAGSALARALALLREDKAGQAARLMGQGRMTDDSNRLKSGLDQATGTWPDLMDRLPLPTGPLPDAQPLGTPFMRGDGPYQNNRQHRNVSRLRRPDIRRRGHFAWHNAGREALLPSRAMRPKWVCIAPDWGRMVGWWRGSDHGMDNNPRARFGYSRPRTGNPGSIRRDSAPDTVFLANSVRPALIAYTA